jgi:uncharacterized protein involved in exopolysaccharide biosynthesis/Mrp family chromosome partitioning ATPase
MAENLYIKRIKADKWLVLLVTLLVSALGLWAVFSKAKPQFASTAKVWIRSDSRAPYLTSLEREGADKPMTMAANPILTQLELMTSAYVAQSHLAFLKKEAPQLAKRLQEPGKSPEQFLKTQFKSTNVISTDTVQVTYFADNPALAQKGLKNILNNYLAYRYQIDYGGKNRQAVDIDHRLADTEKRLITVRDKIRRYETSSSANDLGAESTELVTKRLATESQIADLNAQIDSAKASVQALSSKLPYKNINAAIQAVAMGANGNPLIELRQRLTEAKQLYAFDAIKLAPTNPKMVSQKRKINEIQQEINQEIKRTLGKGITNGKGQDLAIYDATRTKMVNDLLDANVKLQGLTAQKASMLDVLNDFRTQESNLPTKRYNLKNLQQEEGNLALAFDALRKQQLEAKLKSQDSLDNVLVVIDPPSLPDREQAPTRNQLAALTVLLGVMAGVGASLLRTRLSGFCSDPKAISDITQRPILATIPWFASGYQQSHRSLAMDNASDEAIARLLLQVREHHYQVLTLTSDCQGAHRPTLLMQLGRKFAESGYRVALLDTNFRCPSLACRVEIYPEQSLSQLIERFNTPVDDAAAQALIREFAYIDTDNNLACLLNEQPLVSPGRYLCSQGFERLLHHLRKQFDLVLINTPSILYAPEATAVASLSDAIIAATSYAVRESVVVQLTKQLEAVHRPFLGTIIRADK